VKNGQRSKKILGDFLEEKHEWEVGGGRRRRAREDDQAGRPCCSPKSRSGRLPKPNRQSASPRQACATSVSTGVAAVLAPSTHVMPNKVSLSLARSLARALSLAVPTLLPAFLCAKHTRRQATHAQMRLTKAAETHLK
jgi:hypothetical protein